MNNPISITAIASVSPLGTSIDQVWASYRNEAHRFVKKHFSGADEWVAPLTDKARAEIDRLKKSDAKYKNLDNSVLFALYASRMAAAMAGWSVDPSREDSSFGINIGSSRGATSLFEKYHEEFLRDNRAATLSSPTTTLGNISSWVAHDLQSRGPEISHSITCSTALHALLNGVAWIKSGMTDRFLVGGSEAPLTPFTIAQMKALKIYSGFGSNNGPENGDQKNAVYPCQALNLDKRQNTMILGEGAAVACLEKDIPNNAMALIEGIGYATEPLRHNTSISADAQCFQRSMRMALGENASKWVDVIVMHAPGTVKGDLSEFMAIEKVFDGTLPALTTNKWKVGHTFGASGMLNIELAVLMLQHQEFVPVPFLDSSRISESGATLTKPQKIERVMVNAVGFGGNAVSILLRLPPKNR